jgi:hypothetical protein
MVSEMVRMFYGGMCRNMLNTIQKTYHSFCTIPPPFLEDSKILSIFGNNHIPVTYHNSTLDKKGQNLIK